MGYRIAYDPQSCINCYSCMVQCAVENRVRLERETGWGPERTMNMSLDYLYYLTPVPREVGTYPETRCITEFHHCQHCENAPCARACPADTIEVRHNGLVVIHEEGCIGCQSCVEACPWDVPKYNPATNKVYKCLGCYDRVDAGMEPACVSACPSVALFAGEEEDVVAEAKQRAAHYQETFGKEFIAYGTDKVSNDVGHTGWVTVAPKDDAGHYGLKDNPSATPLNVRNATATLAGFGTLGLVGMVGVHFLHWLAKRKDINAQNDTATTKQALEDTRP
jgi:formate dehydrogenase iron-sulfur subunit